MIEKAQKEDLKEILELQYLTYQSEAKLFGNMDIPPLSKPLKKYMMNLKEEDVPVPFILLTSRLSFLKYTVIEIKEKDAV